MATDTRAADPGPREPAASPRVAGGPVAFHTGPNGDITYADLLTGKVRRLVYRPATAPRSASFSSTSDPATRTVDLLGRGLLRPRRRRADLQLGLR